MSELSPPWSNARMSRAQVKKYIRDMKHAQEEAKKRLKKSRTKEAIEKEKAELKALEKELENL